jgi:hypothetical protein
VGCGRVVVICCDSDHLRDDNQKGKSNRRSPAGITTRKATARAAEKEPQRLSCGKSSTIWVWIMTEEARRYG